jgi:hypothetical protein
MATPKFISEFFSWRWMPCVLLASGSLVYVGLALLLVPSGEESHSGSDSASATLRGSQSPSFGSSLFSSSHAKTLDQTTAAATAAAAAVVAASPAPGGISRRGFSPPIEHAAPPPPPPQPPLPPPIPLPAGTSEPAPPTAPAPPTTEGAPADDSQ